MEEEEEVSLFGPGVCLPKMEGGEREEEGGVHTRFLNEWSRVYIFRTRKPGYPGA